MSYLYLILDIGSLLIPLIYSFHPKIRFKDLWKAHVTALIVVALPFLVWDEIFTRMDIWGFDPQYLTGIYLFNLPIEEVLFFFCIPYACVFTYFSLKKLTRYTIHSHRRVTLMLIAVLTLLALFNLDKAYTSTTFLLLAILLGYHLQNKTEYMGRFYFSYVIILIPFFIVNGILTGSFIPGQVVWYDDSHNLGIRMGTIPVEDVFYGMLLILANVTLFERLKR